MSVRLGTKCKYLIDASALYPLLISGTPFNSDECAVITLTEYEVGNVLLKENQKKKLKNPQRIAEIFSEAIRPLAKIEIESISDVLSIAIERNLTFYDASYVHSAERNGLTLVTQDNDLLKKCKLAITIDKLS